MAGVSLLERSRLVSWHTEQLRFVPTPHDIYEKPFERNVFGRLASWIDFSAGAEMLAKGVCLLNGISIRYLSYVYEYPPGDLEAWSTKVVNDRNGKGATRQTTNYGTLSNLTDKDYPKIREPNAFSRLFRKIDGMSAEKRQVVVAYKFLASTIRNRDAHAYVPKVRDGHFLLVSQLFAPCFDVLVSWIPGGSSQVTDWKDQDAASDFIMRLPEVS